ncbi:MAG: hypothetical protein RL585_533, partial [Pseudomonadota bacterium]
MLRDSSDGIRTIASDAHASSPTSHLKALDFALA